MRSPEGMELAALCLDLDYKLADSPRNLTRHQVGFLMAALQMRAEAVETQQLATQGVTRIVFRDDDEEGEKQAESSLPQQH